MKKYKKVLLAGGCLLAAYGIGRVVGHIECLDTIIDKHKIDIFKNSNEFIDNVGKFMTIIVTKPAEKETEECNA